MKRRSVILMSALLLSSVHMQAASLTTTLCTESGVNAGGEQVSAQNITLIFAETLKIEVKNGETSEIPIAGFRPASKAEAMESEAESGYLGEMIVSEQKIGFAFMKTADGSYVLSTEDFAVFLRAKECGKNQ